MKSASVTASNLASYNILGNQTLKLSQLNIEDNIYSFKGSTLNKTYTIDVGGGKSIINAVFKDGKLHSGNLTTGNNRWSLQALENGEQNQFKLTETAPPLGGKPKIYIGALNTRFEKHGNGEMIFPSGTRFIGNYCNNVATSGTMHFSDTESCQFDKMPDVSSSSYFVAIYKKAYKNYEIEIKGLVRHIDEQVRFRAQYTSESAFKKIEVQIRHLTTKNTLKMWGQCEGDLTKVLSSGKCCLPESKNIASFVGNIGLKDNFEDNLKNISIFCNSVDKEEYRLFFNNIYAASPTPNKYFEEEEISRPEFQHLQLNLKQTSNTRDKLSNSLTLIWFAGGKLTNRLPIQYQQALVKLLNELKDLKKPASSESDAPSPIKTLLDLKVILILDHAIFLRDAQFFITLAQEHGNYFEINFSKNLVFNDLDAKHKDNDEIINNLKKLNRIHLENQYQVLGGNPAIPSDFYRLASNLIAYENVKANIYIDFDDLEKMQKDYGNHLTEINTWFNKGMEKDAVISVILYSKANIVNNNRLHFNLSKPENKIKLFMEMVKFYNKKNSVRNEYYQSNNLTWNHEQRITQDGPGFIEKQIRSKSAQIITTDIPSAFTLSWASNHTSLMKPHNFNNFLDRSELKDTKNLLAFLANLNTSYQYNFPISPIDYKIQFDKMKKKQSWEYTNLTDLLTAANTGLDNLIQILKEYFTIKDMDDYNNKLALYNNPGAFHQSLDELSTCRTIKKFIESLLKIINLDGEPTNILIAGSISCFLKENPSTNLYIICYNQLSKIIAAPITVSIILNKFNIPENNKELVSMMEDENSQNQSKYHKLLYNFLQEALKSPDLTQIELSLLRKAMYNIESLFH